MCGGLPCLEAVCRKVGRGDHVQDLVLILETC
jgi:hypothetical protein